MNNNMNGKTFGFKGVEEVMGRVEPGIDELVITGVEDNTNDNGKYYLAIKTVSLDKKREHEERFYFTTEQAQKISLQRLKSLLKELLGPEQAEAEYTVEQLNAQLTGKKFRGKFVGEEYEYDDSIRIRTSFAYSNFVEKLDIPATESKLKFNPDKDIKRLPAAPSASKPAVGEKPKNDIFD